MFQPVLTCPLLVMMKGVKFFRGLQFHSSTPPSHLTTLLPFPPSHLITLPPFPASHLTNLPPTFYFPEAMQHNFVLEIHIHFLE